MRNVVQRLKRLRQIASWQTQTWCYWTDDESTITVIWRKDLDPGFKAVGEYEALNRQHAIELAKEKTGKTVFINQLCK